MRTAILAVLISLLLLPYGKASAAFQETEQTMTDTQIRIVFQQQEVVIAIFDTPASKDFLTLLPLTLEFSDFARAEKVAHLPRSLNIRGTLPAIKATGDFTYYAPWGNLAVFYKGLGSDRQLYTLGRIITGKEALATMTKSFTARIERVE